MPTHVLLRCNFELAIKLLFEEYLNKKNEILSVDYTKKESLMLNNVREALKCLDGFYEYRHDDDFKNRLKANLLDSLCSSSQYSFIPELLTDSFMNAKLAEIGRVANNIMESADFSDRIKHNPFIVKLLVEQYGITQSEAATRAKSDATLMKEIDEIVNARHKIAHSGTQSDLNNIEEIGNKNCCFFERYIQALNSVLKTDLLKLAVDKNSSYVEEIKPNQFSHKNVVCFDNPCERIEVGETLLIYSISKAKYRSDTVVTLQKNDTVCDYVVAGDQTGAELFDTVNTSNNLIYFFK